MKAIVKTKWKPFQIEMKDVDVPKICQDEVLIKVTATGICGTDLEIYKATMPLSIKLPRIIGHEFSGVLANVGRESALAGFKIGDRVVAESGVVCRQCIFCKRGKQNLCTHRKPIGFMLDGAFAEYIKMPYINIHRLPDNVSSKEAALVEPLTVGVHSVIEQAKVINGDVIAIFGAGTIGLILLQLARFAGAKTVIQIDRVENRLRMASRCGADIIINSKKEELFKKVKQLLDSYPNVVFEATGNINALDQAIKLTSKGGRTALLGIYTENLLNLDATDIVKNEKTILGCWTHTSSTWNRAISLLSNKKVDLKPLITHVLPLENVEEGFHLFNTRKAIKVLLKPNKLDN
jgi:2-desacetyl-2-hydroxyethyl bacteriochlorophyllide A dehydrogenase